MALTEKVRTELVAALSELPVLMNPAQTLTLLQGALRDAPFGQNFLGGVVLTGGMRATARHLVINAERAGDPPGDLLRRILVALLSEVTEPRHQIVFNAAIERLDRSEAAIPGAPPSALALASDDTDVADATDVANEQRPNAERPPDGPLAMVSFSHADAAEVESLVHALRIRGVNITWDRDQESGGTIATWVVSTYQRADWIVLACSPNYGASVEDLLKNVVGTPPTGRGVAQEVRLMCSEDLHYGPARFVPVMLTGAALEHIPLVALGQPRYAMPEQLGALAEALKQPGPRSASSRERLSAR